MGLLSKLARPVIRPIREFRDSRDRYFVLRHFGKHTVGAEVGVWKGGFAEHIIEVVKPSKLYLIDPWKYQESPEFARALYGGVIGENQARMDAVYRSVVERFRWHIVHGVVEIHRGPSQIMLAKIPDSSLDWIYVDGDHRYDGVLSDLRLAHQKLKPGGIVGGDDYTNVTAWWGDGVPRAVNEVIARGLFERVIIRKNQFVLKAVGRCGASELFPQIKDSA